MGQVPSITVLIVVTLATVYAVYSNYKLNDEVKRLRSLMDASVTLHELEEQVLPTLDALEQDTGRLQKEMQQLSRRLSDKKAHAASNANVSDASEDSDENIEEITRTEEDVAAIEFTSVLPRMLPQMLKQMLPEDISVLTVLPGMTDETNVAGVKTTRVHVEDEDPSELRTLK